MIVFIPGLNTYGDGRIHFGPLPFGLMHASWEREARARSLEFAALTSIGHAGLPAEFEHALKRFDALKSARPAFFIGHSAGGLVAHAIAGARPDRVAGVLTVGTPHVGAAIAELAMRLQDRRPLWNRIFRTFGYDVAAKSDAFRHLTPDGVAQFRAQQLATDLPAFYAQCEAKGFELGLPFLALHAAFPEARLASSDGFVSTESQAQRGVRLGAYRLDHFAQLGCFLQIGVAQRTQARREFARLVDDSFRLASQLA